jgi:hypothetical protein
MFIIILSALSTAKNAFFYFCTKKTFIFFIILLFFYNFVLLIKKRKNMTNEEAFIKYKEIFNFANVGKELEDIVDVETFMKTPAAPSIESGVAYDGAIMFHTLMVWHFANKLLPIYNKISSIDVHSLAKVIVLHQLGKVGMFSPNTDDWQVKKLGKVYTFNDSDACLKNGERSKLVCSNAGVVFNNTEYEAMGILDKTPEEYENMTKYRTHLSTLLKMSSDMAYAVARERYKNSLKHE